MKDMPDRLSKRTEGFSWEQMTIGRSEAKTFFLQGSTYNQYLKIQPVNAVENLSDEKDRLQWLRGKLPVPEVVYYDMDHQNEYLLMTEVKGTNASDQIHLANVTDLIKQVGTGLQVLHHINTKDCPFNQTLEPKIAEAKRRAENSLVDEEDFDGIRKGMKASELFEELLCNKPNNEDLVFTHGDYCLPNIILSKGKVSGFIDVGRAGVADRYQDVALAIRSITSNFGKEYIPYFLEGYGMTDVDETKMDYYQLMDEFF
ncbi:aminoglycoside 3'-phosphotransferase [Gracilibacillus caseinilyticus]|uniref:Aminoglycoside 3'-phosphotransferase n=1 Tax=Gracilibacillus caseinilyticus TaxID=2932256 RepID=A0ABY4F1Q0_9BACI|nr:APH(3') family aminoglycoside O-phosphotransferase [Gracilibacillus caseinilyticus]UOQ50135.1 aminoglycoside 3'-phosphotransferase [Gracilibacillus caseinilyticus]